MPGNKTNVIVSDHLKLNCVISDLIVLPMTIAKKKMNAVFSDKFPEPSPDFALWTHTIV